MTEQISSNKTIAKNIPSEYCTGNAFGEALKV